MAQNVFRLLLKELPVCIYFEGCDFHLLLVFENGFAVVAYMLCGCEIDSKHYHKYLQKGQWINPLNTLKDSLYKSPPMYCDNDLVGFIYECKKFLLTNNLI